MSRNYRWPLTVGFLVLLAIGAKNLLCGQTASPELLAEISQIKAKASQGYFKQFRIIYYPVHNTTRIALTPTALEQQCEYVVLGNNIDQNTLFFSFCSALERTRFEPSDPRMDLRLGFQLIANDGSVELSLYCDGRCCRGILNGKPVAIKGELKTWFNERVANFER